MYLTVDARTGFLRMVFVFIFGQSGMPSSHASSLSFFASTLVLLNPGELVYIAFFAAAMVAASWRVGAGYHTRAQVVAGVAWGGAVAFFWVFCAMPALEATVTGALQGRFGPWPLTCAIGFVVCVYISRLWMNVEIVERTCWTS